MFNINKKIEIDFSPYLEINLSEESKEKLKEFSKSNPKIKKELIEHSKNAMANTIYDKNQTKDYIDGVKDTLKYINRYL